MEIKIPAIGESVFEAQVGKWHRQTGDQVKAGEILVELETDKISLELTAEADGTLEVLAREGETLPVGTVLARLSLQTGVEAAKEEPQSSTAEGKPPSPPKAPKPPAAPRTPEKPVVPEAPAPKPVPPPEKLPSKAAAAAAAIPRPPAQGDSRITRTPMTPIRKRIAERLLAARQQTAMLTTFNEADMSRVTELRHKYGESFRQRHGVKLGLMSFFVKACVEALREFPLVNARIDGDDIVQHHYFNLGVAIGSERGLVVPVLRDADRLHFAEIEAAIAAFADKAQGGKLELSDLEGGTFTLSNGGIYGSLLSTPILNPPQSAVLGMHAIQQRPVVRDGAIVIRPMMNLALSYDHRIIDGREAVGFLKKVKACIEEPEEMLLEL